jgi:hypothetical protein
VNVSKDAKAIVTNEIALKVVDIFGNGTMTIFDVSVGEPGQNG